MFRGLKVFVPALALVCLLSWSGPIFADTTTGKIKSVDANKNTFVYTDRDGKNWTFHLKDNAKVNVNNTEKKLSDLKAGDNVTVTYEKRGNDLWATDINTAMEETTGKVKSIAANDKSFVFTDKAGKDWTFHLMDNAKIRLNNKDEKLGDLKAGDEVTVVYEKKNDQFWAKDVYSPKK